MNEYIDLRKILKDCPKGTILYSLIHGYVEFSQILDKGSRVIEVISITSSGKRYVEHYTFRGQLHSVYNNDECVLFPSQTQRDWSKFTAPWYKKPIEQKFKVGQYITDGYDIGQIIEDDCHCYKILDLTGCNNTIIPFTLQDNYHLWTIQDAKDGDVLCRESGWMCIFKALNNHTNTFSSYCFMDSDKCFFNIGIDGHTLDKNFIKAYNGEIYPATKEQCDIFFQKMKEAGYKWNNETKTLENLVKPKFKVGDRVRNKETNKHDVYEIRKVYADCYWIAGFPWMIYMKYQDQYELIPNKFDPKTLKVLDKVLVKDTPAKLWNIGIFSHYVESDTFPYKCVGNYYKLCIPYNDDTKHLVGTTEEAPDFYRYWED